MAPPNIPADFDFLDPDVNLAGLPVDELAELRKAEPIHWVDVPGGTGGFEDKGYWLVTKHADVKEVSRRSDVFSSWQNGAIPTWPQGDDARARSSCSAASCSTWTRRTTPGCARSSPAGSRPAPSDGWRTNSRSAPQNIAKTAAAEGSGDFVEQVSLRAAAAGHRRSARCAAGRPRQAVPLVQRDDRRRGSRVRRRRSRAVVDGTDHVRDGRWPTSAARTPPTTSSPTLIQADIDGEKLSDDEFGFFVIMLAVAGNETTRNSITHGMIAFSQNPDQWELFKKERPSTAADEIIRWATPVSAFQRTAIEDVELGGVQIKKGQRVGDVLPLGQLRRRGLRGPAHLQHPARPEPARRVRRHRRALLHRREPGPDDDQPDLQRGRRPHARSQAHRRARAATVGLAQRHQALAGRLHRRSSAVSAQ